MKKFFKNSGFTLFELLAVLAILAIVAGIAVPRVLQTITNARVTALEAEMQLVGTTVQRMFTEEEINAPGNSPGMDVQFYIMGVDISAELDNIVPLYTEYETGGPTDHAPSDFVPYVYDSGQDGFYDSSYTTDLRLQDYLEGGVPDYLTVLVVDENAIDDVAAGTNPEENSGIGAIVVIYDDAYETYGSITKADLELESDYDFVLKSDAEEPYDSDDYYKNVVVKTFEYNGEIGD
ncbi:MAG: type II secretion system protein [Eubacteriales bacterium]